MIVYFTYIRSSTFPHIAACDKISFLLRLNNILYYVYTTFLFIHPSINGHLGYFYLLAIVSNADMNTTMQISLPETAFSYFVYMPRSGMARSYGSSIFNFLRNSRTVFQRVCIILQSLQQCTKI